MAKEITEDPLIVGGDFIGKEKPEAALGLADFADDNFKDLTDEQFARKRSRNVDFGEDEGFVGPPKPESALALSNLRDSRNQENLTPEARKNPKERDRVKGRAGSVEAFLDLPGGSLLDVESEFFDIGTITRAKGPAGVQKRRDERKALRDSGGNILDSLFTGAQPAQVFGNIDDVQLSGEQKLRFDELVASGDIDAASLFQGPPSGSGSLAQFFGRPSGKLVPGASGLTLEQAINIVVGPSDPALSQFDPTTGLAFDPRDISRAIKFQRDYLISQGLPALDFTQFPNNTNLDLRLLPFAEARATGGRTQDLEGGTSKRVTLEQLTLIAELVSGKSRSSNNARVGQPKNFEDTLLSGDFLI